MLVVEKGRVCDKKTTLLGGGGGVYMERLWGRDLSEIPYSVSTPLALTVVSLFSLES